MSSATIFRLAILFAFAAALLHDFNLLPTVVGVCAVMAFAHTIGAVATWISGH